MRHIKRGNISRTMPDNLWLARDMALYWPGFALKYFGGYLNPVLAFRGFYKLSQFFIISYVKIWLLLSLLQNDLNLEPTLRNLLIVLKCLLNEPCAASCPKMYYQLCNSGSFFWIVWKLQSIPSCFLSETETYSLYAYSAISRARYFLLSPLLSCTHLHQMVLLSRFPILSFLIMSFNQSSCWFSLRKGRIWIGYSCQIGIMAGL